MWFSLVTHFPPHHEIREELLGFLDDIRLFTISVVSIASFQGCGIFVLGYFLGKLGVQVFISLSGFIFFPMSALGIIGGAVSYTHLTLPTKA